MNWDSCETENSRTARRRLGVDQVCGITVSISTEDMRSLDGALHAHRPTRYWFSYQLADRAHPAIARWSMSSISLAVAQIEPRRQPTCSASGAAGARRGAVRGHRHGGRGCPRFGRLDRGAPHRGGRPSRTPPAIVVRATGETDPSKSGVDIYRLQKFQRSNQEHLHQPAPAGESRRPGQEGRHSSPTVPRPISASLRSAATCWSPSCRGTATTSRTRSSCPSASSRTTSSPRSISRNSR